MAAAAAGPGPGSGPGDSPEGPEAEAPERRRKAHGMLKLYYGLSEGEAAGRPSGSDPLDPTDLNGAHFDPEVYLDKVCVFVWGCVCGGTRLPMHRTLGWCLRLCCGLREAALRKKTTTLGQEARAELESRGAWADLDWPQVVRCRRCPGVTF